MACIGGCKGVIGFKVGTWLCHVREKVCPARLKHTKFGVFVARWASLSRLPAPQPRIAGDAVPYMQEMVGVLHYMKPSGCVSPACRSLM